MLAAPAEAFTFIAMAHRVAVVTAVLLVLSVAVWASELCKANDQGRGPYDKPCVFPFVYLGTVYNECVSVFHNGTKWCGRILSVCVS